MRRILIVTPTFNAEAYLDETVLSIVSQVGDFDLHYHVQDAGSDDATQNILSKWDRLISERRLPCGRVKFTYAIEKDSGMYDAINKGFLRLDPKPQDIMAWLGSDDILNIGALATVSSVFDTFLDADFIGGRHAHIDDRSIGRNINFVAAYSRELMRIGLYDGRAQPFVMQEGTFWRGRLWQNAGGLDANFKLAGDWDLWRRFAVYTDFYSIDAVLAFHRRRYGQLSKALDRYWAEVDLCLGVEGRRLYAEMARFVDSKSKPAFTGLVLSGTTGEWKIQRITAAPAADGFSDMIFRIAELETSLHEAKVLQKLLVGIPSKRMGELFCTCAKAERFVVAMLPRTKPFFERLNHAGVGMQLRASFLEQDPNDA